MATIYIDDQPYQVEDGKNVLEAALGLGLDLPYFCWHPAMGSVGACRQCALVQYRDEEDTRGRIVMGCMTTVTDGARFSMQGETASTFRENIVESLMLNHPHDCPVCAEGGECHLQDMTVMVGHRDRRYRGKKNTHRNQYLGPLINHEMNRCISCYRCTRFYQDYAGGKDLAAHAAHDHVYFGRHQEGTLESEFAGNLVEVCPTGVFTDKPLVNDYTRKWDMQSAPSVCGGCALGCNTIPGERYGELKRVHNRFNLDVNGYFLCDRGRYGHSYVNDEQRPSFAGIKTSNGRFDAIDEADAILKLRQLLANSKVAAIGSPRASLESNFLLKQLVEDEHFCSGVADHEAELLHSILDVLQNGAVKTPSMHDIEAADAVLILGEDISNTAPRMALSVRQAVQNKAKQLAREMRIPEWQDEAVRTLAQDQRSPLFVTATTETRLDDIATQSYNANADEIARLGFAIAALLDSSLPEVEGLSEDQQTLAKQAAKTLKSASKPLVISGTACQSKSVIEAATAIAHALRGLSAGEQTMLSFCLPEANSLGVSMLTSQKSLSLQELLNSANSIDTLIVLENDLYRRCAEKSVNDLLENISHLVVLDSLPSPTMERADLVLPAATLIESEGTLVSSEGRAQRHYPVYLAADQRAPSWQWLTKMGKSIELAEFKNINYFDDVAKACAASQPNLEEMVSAAPEAEFKNRGLKIPRQPHRYSGRTAMRADISVHEPKQPEDPNTPLSFTMEGRNGEQPGALLPFVWSPGWNSNQSLHKFQSEVGGALSGGTAGKRLFEPRTASNHGRSYEVPAAGPAQYSGSEFSLQPSYQIFGSEELSARCDAIKELVPAPFVQINTEDADSLDLADGQQVTINFAGQQLLVTLKLSASVNSGFAMLPAGLPGVPYFTPGLKMTISGGDDV